ncbi:MAG: hypothetical protein K8S99_05480 [Planctomycetes bacterium]|nr:hypothetical protein [Planctomycetota bacterium]
MNKFQKIGAFICRIVGLVMALIAAFGLLYFAYLSIAGHADMVPRDRLAGSIWWLLIGGILLIFSRQIGNYLGRGLDD